MRLDLSSDYRRRWLLVLDIGVHMWIPPRHFTITAAAAAPQVEVTGGDDVDDVESADTADEGWGALPGEGGLLNRPCRRCSWRLQRMRA